MYFDMSSYASYAACRAASAAGIATPSALLGPAAAAATCSMATDVADAAACAFTPAATGPISWDPWTQGPKGFICDWWRQWNWHQLPLQDQQDSDSCYCSMAAPTGGLYGKSDGIDWLAEEPNEIVLVRSASGEAADRLSADAASADIVAFDTEWQPDRSWGSDNPVLALQLAFPSSRRAYVLQLERMDGTLPPAVRLMFANPQVTKVAFSVGRVDLAKLARSSIVVTKLSIVDLQQQCWKRLGMVVAYGRLGLQHAAQELLGYRMSKEKRLSCTDWSSSELTTEQVRDVGLDVWVTLRLYAFLHFAVQDVWE